MAFFWPATGAYAALFPSSPEATPRQVPASPEATPRQVPSSPEATPRQVRFFLELEIAVFCSGGNGGSEDTLGINTYGINTLGINTLGINYAD
ncbi:MAG: hypothetical protein OEW48_02925 [Phycisphaerae bacterium]|nr:hypothetical protein [Phycisphaerae bacterium]